MKLFLQDTPNDCGAACLATVLHYFGRFVTPIDLAKAMEISRGGATHQEIQRVAALHGLSSRLIRLELDQFSRLTDAAIACTATPGQDAFHAVVIFAVKKDKIYIGDPGNGKRWISFTAFREIYKGLVIVFRPDESFEKAQVSEPYSQKFWRFIAQWRWPVAQSLGLGMVASAVGFLGIYLARHFVDRVLPQGQNSVVLGFAAVLLGARCLHLLLSGLNDLLGVKIRNLVQRALTVRFFEHTLALEKRHIDNRETGDFLNKLTQIDGLTQGIASYFSSFILVCLGVIVKVGLLVWLYEPTLVGVILMLVALNTTFGFLLARANAENTNRNGLIQTRVNTLLLSSIEDVRVVRTFNASNWLKRNFMDLMEEGLGLARRMALLRVGGTSISKLLNGSAEALIYLICGYRILAGTYSLGDFLVFLTFALGLAAESTSFPALIQNFQVYLRAFARLQAVQELPTELSGARKLPEGPIEIRFEHVSFAYNKQAPVLRDISFHMKAGETTAIVGESGAGKTTILNLLMGFYRPDSGRILVNGIDLVELDLDHYRNRLSAVFQGTPIFNKNVFNNVTLGNPNITLAEVRAIAAKLGMQSFIEKLPGGFEYLIYPGVLSGGQTQRVGILRAMCKPFDLLVLDEATSHLDSLTEEGIVKGIDEISRGRSRLVIAHRLSTIVNAHQILVIKQGKLAEQGRHEELVKLRGVYLALIERQYEVTLAKGVDTTTIGEEAAA